MGYFIRINKRNNFLISTIPNLHPESAKYRQYWKLHKRRIIEGFWGADDKNVNLNVDEEVDYDKVKSNQWRWMPPNLYYYVNFGIILHNPEDAPKTAPKKRIRPNLTDLEWEFFYNIMECKGFSGFADDEQYSSLRELRDYYRLEKAGEDTTVAKKALHKSAFNSEGKLKEYVECRTYIRKLFDRPMGLPLYQNEASNLFWLSARGGGKSNSTAVGCILHELITDGARYYDEESIKNPYQIEVFVGAAIASKSSELLAKAEIAMDSMPGAFGINTPDYAPAPFAKRMSGSLGPNNMKNPWRHEYEKKVGGEWKKYGSKSKVLHGIFTTENPEAAAGTRPGLLIVEEVGLVPNILTVTGSNEACQMKDGTVKFGYSVYIGTGGNVDKIQESEVIFRDPSNYSFLEFDDIWEGSGKIGWFVPATHMDRTFKDEEGNTKEEEAKLHYEKRREKKKTAKDSSAINLEMMNYPLVPTEMFLNARGTIFPLAELKARLGEVTSKPHQYRNAHYFGDLVWVEGKLKWESCTDVKLLTDFPVIDNKDKPGVIEIISMPKKNHLDEVFPNRYIAGTDTYDDDESSTNSLGSILVLDLWTNKIVAEYTGRRLTSEFYEITRKLCHFYRAINNYENNKKGLYNHYDKNNSTHLLCDTPESLKDIGNITISKIGNKAKGTNASVPVISHGLRLILEWLLEPAYKPDGTKDNDYTNLDTIQNIGFLKELINFNPETGNYDRISAFIMLMILKEDRFKITENRKKKEVKSLAEDDFFTRNYNSTKNSNGHFTKMARQLEGFSHKPTNNIFDKP